MRKNHVDIDGVRSPRDNMSIVFNSNGYVHHYRDPENFYGEYVGEELLKFFIVYTDMKCKNPIQVIDLSFQIDHINPKKNGIIWKLKKCY